MNKMLDTALAYAERGWYVLPIKPNEKIPLTKHGVKDATTDPEIIAEWWKTWPSANIAIDVGRSGMMVYDLDPGSSIKELNEALDGQLPKTELESKTPREGQHLFYALNESDCIPSSASKISKAVDVRSIDGYVLLPPSSTADGKYQWVKQGEATYRTDEMVRTAYTGKEKSKDHDTWIIEQDIPENVKLAIAWLRVDAEIAIQGEGGDECTYKTACMMKSYGLSQAKALELMQEHWNEDCKPPWDYDELEVKVANGYQYNTSQPGNMTPGFKVAKAKALFKPVYDEDKHRWSNPHVNMYDEIGIGKITPPPWLVEDFIPEKSYAMIYGAYSTFKTFIALDIALSVTTGGLAKEHIWGNCKYGNVLFAAGEGHGQFNKRLKVWKQYKINGKSVGGIILADTVPKITDLIEPYLELALEASPDGYKLMVLDTVGRSMQGVNENAQENASAFTAMVEAVQKTLGCAVLALHHTGKSDTGPRGSSVFGADADVVIALARNPGDYTVAMDMEKQKDSNTWEKPKHLRLKEVYLSDTLKSLVPVSYTPLKQTDEKKNAKGEIFLRKITDQIIYETLKEDPARAWTQAALADVVGTDVRMRGKAKDRAIKVYINDVSKAESGYKSTLFFDAKKTKKSGQWGWRV